MATPGLSIIVARAVIPMPTMIVARVMVRAVISATPVPAMVVTRFVVWTVIRPTSAPAMVIARIVIRTIVRSTSTMVVADIVPRTIVRTTSTTPAAPVVLPTCKCKAPDRSFRSCGGQASFIRCNRVGLHHTSLGQANQPADKDCSGRNRNPGCHLLSHFIPPSPMHAVGNQPAGIRLHGWRDGGMGLRFRAAGTR